MNARVGSQDASSRDDGIEAETSDRNSRLDTLIGLFLRGRTECERTVSAALAPLPVADAVRAGLLEPDGDRLRAGVCLQPYESWWVITDLPREIRPLRPDHVVGIGPASHALMRAIMRLPVSAALDLGTGCGVQALHLSLHAKRITATDLSARALRFAATTFALNDLNCEVLQGDLTAPVENRRFDLVISNPPYVVGPRKASYVYRDSDRAGDAICAELAAAAPKLLTDGGHLQYSANWMHVRGQDWAGRVNEWIKGTGLDAWVIQRAVIDPVNYVDSWLNESDEVHSRRRTDWLEWFEMNDIEAIGAGFINLRNSGRSDPIVRIEELPQQVEQPFGAQISAWFSRQDWLSDHDLFSARLITAANLRLTQEAKRGAGKGWQLERQLVSTPSGLRWTVEVDPLIADLVGSADGTLTVNEHILRLGATHEIDPSELTAEVMPVVAQLVERGILVPGPLD